MVRRGSRTTGSGNTTSSTLSSSESNHNSNRWRPHSANSTNSDGGKDSKSSGSSKSSPTGSRLSTSPPVVKKGSGGKTARSSSHWRTRAVPSHGRNLSSDPKFSITNEDFPALPGARGSGAGSSVAGKSSKRDRDNGKHIQSMGDIIATDDSGVSMGSRGHTPTHDSTRTANGNGKIGRGDFESKKKPSPMSASSSEHPRRKLASSPIKERAPRGGVKHARVAVQQPVTSASPRKKTINANSSNTAPSFMKLSKVGQKIPERRGGSRSNHQGSPLSPTSPTYDDKENKHKKDGEHPSVAMVSALEKMQLEEEHSKLSAEKKEDSTLPASSHCIFNSSDVPKIILGPDGEMSNIPATMLTDQFGMAAMLPILDIVKNRNPTVDVSSLSEEKKKEKLLKENIEMTSIGFDLNELGVPIKTTEIGQKAVWDTFAGPFGQNPLLPTSMGLNPNQVPSAYYTARTIQSSFDMLNNIPDKFGLHELFFIFYNLPKEIWQLNAARELQFRGWRYNKVERLWVHKMLLPNDCSMAVVPPMNPFTKPGANPDAIFVGTFEIYDACKARICSREMTLRRCDFEVPAWEQQTPDVFQKMLSSVFPKEMLWGPRDDRTKGAMMPGVGGGGMTGFFPPGSARNKLSNLVISKPQPSRLLSFADSPDVTPNFESSFELPNAPSSIELFHQRMLAEVMHKMQTHQHHQQQPQHQSQMYSPMQHAPRQQPNLASSSSLSNYFQ